MTLGERLKLLRDEQNLKQKEVADFMGVQPNAYSQYEKNKRTPDIYQIKNLCKLYRCSLDYLLNEVE